jgi:hypothetical protein
MSPIQVSLQAFLVLAIQPAMFTNNFPVLHYFCFFTAKHADLLHHIHPGGPGLHLYQKILYTVIILISFI